MPHKNSLLANRASPRSKLFAGPRSDSAKRNEFQESFVFRSLPVSDELQERESWLASNLQPIEWLMHHYWIIDPAASNGVRNPIPRTAFLYFVRFSSVLAFLAYLLPISFAAFRFGGRQFIIYSQLILVGSVPLAMPLLVERLRKMVHPDGMLVKLMAMHPLSPQQLKEARQWAYVLRISVYSWIIGWQILTSGYERDALDPITVGHSTLPHLLHSIGLSRNWVIGIDQLAMCACWLALSCPYATGAAKG